MAQLLGVARENTDAYISDRAVNNRTSWAINIIMLLTTSVLFASALTVPFDAKTTAAQVRQQTSLPSYLNKGVAVVTGANSGLGLESVKELLTAGCRVVLCSRSTEAGETALSSLEGEGIDTSRCRVQKLDLSSLDSVSAAAREILGADSEISLLLNNAGIMATPEGRTADGFELQLGTNHIGHHALTRLLLPAVVPDGRVVTVASTAHTMGSVEVDDLMFSTRKYKPWSAYGQSKAANILFAKGLATRLASEGSSVLSVSLHPGVIRTPLWRYGNGVLTWLLHRFILDKDIPQGAATSIFAALAPAEDLTPGAYLSDCAVATPNEQCTDESGEARDALWKATEELIAKAGLALPADLLPVKVAGGR